MTQRRRKIKWLSFDPWGPISQLLFQLIDSDGIQDIVSATGAPVDWSLNEREAYSNRTRVRAFRQRIVVPPTTD